MDNDTLPQYIQIALSIARRIAGGDVPEGAKISGRSKLSSEYNVSPETIRKAVRLLGDMRVVDVREQSGVYVLSADNASVICMILSQSWMYSISDGISQSYWSSRATSHTNLPICAAVFLTMPCFLFRQTIPCQTIFSAFQRDGMATEGISASCISGRRQVRQS